MKAKASDEECATLGLTGGGPFLIILQGRGRPYIWKPAHQKCSSKLVASCRVEPASRGGVPLSEGVILHTLLIGREEEGALFGSVGEPS